MCLLCKFGLWIRINVRICISRISSMIVIRIMIICLLITQKLKNSNFQDMKIDLICNCPPCQYIRKEIKWIMILMLVLSSSSHLPPFYALSCSCYRNVLSHSKLSLSFSSCRNLLCVSPNCRYHWFLASPSVHLSTTHNQHFITMSALLNQSLTFLVQCSEAESWWGCWQR